jgi:hypothetical protein
MNATANRQLHAAERSTGGKSPHDIRAEFLDNLAVLMGFTTNLACGLPDGRRPDVLRMNIEHGSLFLGDAKDTETPGCQETQVRLLAYFRWLAIQVNHREGLGLFALCVKPGSDVAGWVRTVLWLGREVGILNIKYDVKKFDSRTAVVWFWLR